MAENPLAYENISKLLKGFAIPSITATLVSSLYNIVDQIFIGQGVGYLGNAATNVSYPLSTICLAISLLLGIGSAARFSLYLGKKEPEHAARLVGNGIVLMVGAGFLYLICGELFLTPLLRVFGATEEVLPFARQYAGVVLLGMPFLILTNGISNLIRADGSPRYSMLCMVAGAIVNTILDPIFIFLLDWDVFGAALATILGQLLSFALALRYLWRFRTVQLTRSCFRLDFRDNLRHPLYGHQQLHQSGGHHIGPDRTQQLPHLLWCPLCLWEGNPPGGLRHCHENQRHSSLHYRRNFPGRTAHHWLQLRRWKI